MITSLFLQNFVIVKEARIEPCPKLNVITGETGAGKTLLMSAISAVLGGDTNGSLVGANGSDAWVEVEFEVEESFWRQPGMDVFRDLRPVEDDGTKTGVLVLGRRIASSGRSRAFAWGRSVTKEDLRAAGALLVAAAGQHSGRRMISSSHQRHILDEWTSERSTSAGHRDLLLQMQQAWQDLIRANDAYEAMQRNIELLQKQADEVIEAIALIDAVDPTEQDEESLRQSRDTARNLAMIIEELGRASMILSRDDGAIDMLAVAQQSVARVAEFDAESATVSEQLADAIEQIRDAAAVASSRLDSLGAGAMSIDDIEERLSAYAELHRRFGGTTAAVVAHRDHLAEQAKLIENGDEHAAQAARELEQAKVRAEQAAQALSASRRVGAETLGAAVQEQLEHLGMSHCSFTIDIESTEISASGCDSIVMKMSPGAGVAAQPVARSASGGELSRISLALNALTGMVDAPTVILDEVDAGIGGHTAHGVAKMIEQMSASSQIFCVTHLPQVAARADAHIVVDREPDHANIRLLATENEVVDELVRMSGAPMGDEHAIRQAQTLRGKSRICADAQQEAGALF